MALFRRSKKDAFAKVEAFLDEYQVPSFPGAINEVLGKLREDDTTNGDIAASLEADPGMSIRVLQMVNAPGFGLRHRVDDVSQAVQLIGRSPLESILISLAIKDVLPMKSRPGFDAVAFWRAAAQRAGIASRMAARLHPPDRSFCWTAALLQDVAIPLLVDYAGERYCEILEAWSQGGEPLADLELETLGFDHADLGRKISELWNLSDRLSEAIAGHHAPPTLDTAPVRLVSFIRATSREGEGQPAGVSELLAAAESLELDRDDCGSYVEEGLADAKEMSGLF